MNAEEQARRFRENVETLRREIAKAVVGHDEVVRQTIVAILAGGHALLEGVPGIGKTLLVRTVAQCLRLRFSRIQFTPDLMPADIVGTNIVVDDARFVQAPSLALFLAALAKSLPSTEEPIALAVGLPVALLQREPGQEIARNLRRLLLGTHALEVDGAQLTLRIENVWIRAQPLGIWADWAVQQTGVLHAGARRALVGIVDIGFNTIDLIGIQGGQVNADMVAGRDLGVRVLLEDASEDSDMPLYELTRRFADGVLRVDETQVNRWASEIAAFVRRRWRRARPQLVILAGGGAALMERYGATRVLKGALSSEVFVPGDPVISGAQGLRKLAVGLLARGEARPGPAQHAERQGEAADGETAAVAEGTTTVAPDARP